MSSVSWSLFLVTVALGWGMVQPEYYLVDTADTIPDTSTGFHRGGRSLLDLFVGNRRRCGHPDDCPPHHCRIDEVVTLGVCCGCKLPGDSTPGIRCGPHIRCPPTRYPLCDDYNWMMDCCC